jgi:hypothetical protein
MDAGPIEGVDPSRKKLDLGNLEIPKLSDRGREEKAAKVVVIPVGLPRTSHDVLLAGASPCLNPLRSQPRLACLSGDVIALHLTLMGVQTFQKGERGGGLKLTVLKVRS